MKGGGHGDYHLIVLAPSSVQEMADFVYDAFDLADTYRNPAMILADGALGQMMEKVEFPEYDPAEHIPPKPWATTGKPASRERNVITSLHIQPEKMEQINLHLQEKYRIDPRAGSPVRGTVTRDDAEYVIVAYGLVARIAHRAVQLARDEGNQGRTAPSDHAVPVSPRARSARSPSAWTGMLVVEMNAGQMVEDVRLAVEGRDPVQLLRAHGRSDPLARRKSSTPSRS